MSDGTTHYEGCWESGAKHYACVVRELAACSAQFDRQQQQLDRNAEQIATLRAELEKKAWFSAYEKKEWVGLTDEEWQEIADKTDIIIWNKLKEAIEAKLKEKNGE